MVQLVPIALFGWIPVGLALFLLMPPRRAVLTVFIGGWLFLPMFGVPFEGFPDFDKVVAVGITAMLGTILFDPGRLLALRPHWIDLPVAAWCFVPFVTSLVNGLGAYDGIAVSFHQVLQWGLPWIVGRAYFSDAVGLRELCIGIFIGGLVYVPLCWYEIRFSPQLHMLVYGDHPTPFQMTWRFGGFRPLLFMQGGLAVSLFMAMATLIGFVLWHTRALRSVGPIPVGWLVIVLFITTIGCKSTGAVLLLVAGLGIYFATMMGRTRMVIAAAVVGVPLYLALRIIFTWDAELLVDYAAEYIEEDRAASLLVRVSHESELVRHRVHDAPFFGWGGWGRARLVDEVTGEDQTITDSLWIIAATRYGLISLAGYLAMLMVPILLVVRHVRPAMVSAAATAPMVAVALAIWVYLMDRMVNAQLNVLVIMGAGGLAAIPWQHVRAAMERRRSVRRGRAPATVPPLSRPDVAT